MRNLRVVKEPIHNYIAVSDLESTIFNDPLFQRLHHITQNGTAYLTYPSNRTSRFIHSLGVMHLGGEIFRFALFATARTLRSKLVEHFSEIVSRALTDLSFRIDQLEGHLRDLDDVCYRHYGFGADTRDRVIETVLFQSVRIACVLHDIGHPPFSHTTEHVLTSKLQSAKPTGNVGEYAKFLEALGKLRGEELGQAQKLHENVGTALVKFIFSEIPEEGERRRFAQLCFWIANRIANEGLAEENPDGVFTCLHTIVSSDGFDSDRGDYVLRDGYASSFEFGEYDLARILNSVRFIRSAAGYRLVATTAATSALESFFLERYRVWRWLVFHHSVVRGEVALSRALTILLELFFDDAPANNIERTVQNMLHQWSFGRLWSPFLSESTYRAYTRCDEPWLLSMLHAIRQVLDDGGLPRKLAMLRVYLDFILARRKANFETLWKRAEEYDEFAEAVWAKLRDSLRKLNKSRQKQLRPIRKERSETATEWFNRVVTRYLSHGWLTGEIEAMRSYEGAIQKSLRQAKRNLWGSLLLKPLSFSTRIDCSLIDSEEKEIKIDVLSSVVQNLPVTWRKDMQLRAYWVGLRASKSGYASDNTVATPTRKELGSVFLEAILGGLDYESLKKLMRE